MHRSLSAAGVALAVLIGSPLASRIGLAQGPAPAPVQQPDDKKPDDKKPDDKKPEDKKPDDKKPEDKKPDDKKPDEKKPEAKKPEERKSESSTTKKAASKNSKIKPYDDIVTNDFKSDSGLFFVHKSDDKILYEIPVDVLGKDMLWVRQLEKTGTGSGYSGDQLGDRVVRWEQRGEDILLRDVKYDIRAETKDPINNAVKASSLEPIISVLPVKAYGKDKAPVIDVTELFTGDLPEFSAAQAVGGSGADPRRSFIEGVKSFPENIETKVLVTYRKSGGRGGIPGLPGVGGGGGGGGAVTVLLHHSMVKLPEDLMKPRKYDDRVGFFTEDFQDYGDIKNHQVENVRYITRWRLEKKDPSAEVSEPKKQIVYYIGREVPDKLRPYIKKGVEAWQPAFEKAGFKNAIVAKDAPSEREDPDWDPEDTRYSTIRWLPSTTENAMGPNVHDPRTGEILEADILMYHNVLKLARDWYFVQASPNNPKAQSLPLPDELVGELLTYIVSHEVGHTLGFRHNMKASSAYTVAQLRDPKFTEENGTEASIMDYGRFNYVAQPGDGARLIPILGPYDKFATEWGYKDFKDATTYEQEKAKLDEIVARQIKDATLRFGGGRENPRYEGDPSEQTEDLGDDAIAATELGLKNIDRVAGYLVKATSKKNEDYDQLQNMYGQLISQRNRELNHVAALVGGTVKNNVFYGDGDKPYNAVPGDQQKKAVAFLVANAFTTPKPLIAPDIVQRLEANGAADRILAAQRTMLRSLLSDARIRRMAEQAAIDPKGAYAPIDMLADLRAGLWQDLKGDSPDLDLYRRNLLRAHADLLIDETNKDNANSDLPALARGELLALRGEIDACNDKKIAPTTRLFLDDLRARIKQALEPKAIVQPASPTTTRFVIGGDVHSPIEAE